jgi:hypothetical protein
MVAGLAAGGAAEEAAGGAAGFERVPTEPPNGLKASVLIETKGAAGAEASGFLDIVEKAFQITINLKFKPINFFLSIFIIFFPFTQSSVKQTRRKMAD